MPKTAEIRMRLTQQALDLRAKAERFRTFAEGNCSPVARRTLLEIAQDSDALATRLERQLAELVPLPPPAPAG